MVAITGSSFAAGQSRDSGAGRASLLQRLLGGFARQVLAFGAVRRWVAQKT